LERLKIAALLSLFFFSITVSVAQDAPTGNLRISTTEEIKAEFESVPCKNEERQNAVKALFEKMGARPEEITVEKFKNVENVVIRKAGANGSSEKIVIGAHYDKSEEGCGAVDNWTGIVTLAHIYRTLNEVPLKKNVVYIAFGKEEIGLVGSSEMVKAIAKEQLIDYCAMINIDSLGTAIPQVAENMSSRKLTDLTVNVAREMNIPFSRGSLTGADSDSSSFVKKKIPAVSILGLGKDWKNILHSKNDQVQKVNIDSLYLGYRLAIALLVRIDETQCQALR
jgi:Zn-dependent M28 family amino/carboxypeptidase